MPFDAAEHAFPGGKPRSMPDTVATVSDAAPMGLDFTEAVRLLV